MAYELVLERRGRIKRKGIWAAETKGEDTDSHEQATQTWPVTQHIEAEGPGRSKPGRMGGWDWVTKAVCLAWELGKSSGSPSKDFKSRCAIITFFPPKNKDHSGVSVENGLKG